VLSVCARDASIDGERRRWATVRSFLEGDALLAAVSASMGVLHKRYYGRAPASAKSQMMGTPRATLTRPTRSTAQRRDRLRPDRGRPWM
jgi:hypothetical protein